MGKKLGNYRKYRGITDDKSPVSRRRAVAIMRNDFRPECGNFYGTSHPSEGSIECPILDAFSIPALLLAQGLLNRYRGRNRYRDRIPSRYRPQPEG